MFANVNVSLATSHKWNTTHSHIVVTDLLDPALQGEYSVTLYGAPGRVPIPRVKVVHLSLLGDDALRWLSRAGGICHLHAHHLLMPFYAPINPKFDYADAVWVQQSMYVSRNRAAPNHSWVEVTHCGSESASPSNSTAGRPWSAGAAWFYAAPGSGLSINVGRTKVLGFRDAVALLTRLVLYASACGADGSVFWGTEAKGNRTKRTVGPLRWDEPCPSVPAELQLDSIQVTGHHEFFSAERRHEIVMLRMANCGSMRTWAAHGVVRCGRHPWLSRCSDDSPVVHSSARCVKGLSFSSRVTSLLPIRSLAQRCNEAMNAEVAGQLRAECGRPPPPLHAPSVTPELCRLLSLSVSHSQRNASGKGAARDQQNASRAAARGRRRAPSRRPHTISRVK